MLVQVMALLVLVGSVEAQDGTIRTIAGGGPPDGVAATAVGVGGPRGIAVDSSGNVYIAATDLHRVFKVTRDGAVGTVAGSAQCAFGGDGGLAVKAGLCAPQGLAVDSVGNVYIADSANHRIRKVSTTGVITTVAGVGHPGYYGDGGTATAAGLDYPIGVAVDRTGNLYIADYYNDRVRKVTPGGIITTFAGNGSLSYSGDGGPATEAGLDEAGVAVDSAGNLYVADALNNRIRKVTPDGIITTVAGDGGYAFRGDGGLATSASLNYPRSVATDNLGNLYIGDTGNGRVRRVGTNGIITTIAGNGTWGYSGDGGPSLNASFNYIAAVGVSGAGDIYIADYLNNRVRRASANGLMATAAGNGSHGFYGEGVPATSAQFDLPVGLTVDAGGNAYVADFGNNRVRKVAANGWITTYAGNGDWSFSRDGVLATQEGVTPASVALDGAGNLYIADPNNCRVRKVSPNGVITTVAGNGACYYGGDGGPATSGSMRAPFGLTLDNAGNLYIADLIDARVRKVSGGIITTLAGDGRSASLGDGGPATRASLQGPLGLAVDPVGNVYIGEYWGTRVRKVTPGGTITTVAGGAGWGFSGDGGPATNALLTGVPGLALDVAGNLYVADSWNQRIRKISTSGVITTVVGNGCQDPPNTGNGCYSGDGGPALNASLSRPHGVALDRAGNLYVADLGNSRVRMVTRVAEVCSYQLSNSTTTANPGGDRQVVRVSTANGCSWTAQAAVPWLTVLGSGNGSGPGLLGYIVAPNSSGGARSGAIVVGGRSLTVFQAGTGCPFTLSSQSVTVPAAGGLGNLMVMTAPPCAWTPTATGDWLTVTGSEQTGQGVLFYTASANSGTRARTGSITVAGQAVQMLQRPATPTPVFADVPIGHPYFDYIGILKDAGITSGCRAGDYCPEAVITRSEMAVFVVRALLRTDDFSYSPYMYFADVPQNHPHFKYVQKLYELGITTGCGFYNYYLPVFCPDAVVTRGQMAVFLIRARLGLTSSDGFYYLPAPYFADVWWTHPYFGYIQKMKELGITSGCSVTSYCPDAPTTRGQAAVTVTRALLTP